MKTTIKQKAISLISFGNLGIPRRELVYYILKQNGRLRLGDSEQFEKEFNTKWRGYYSDAFQQWEREGLIKRQKGIYKATELGKAYTHNPKIMGELNKMKSKEFQKRREILERLWEAEDKYRNLLEDRRECDDIINQLSKLLINS